MSKAPRSNVASGKREERVAELAPKQCLKTRLKEIITELDGAQRGLAAAYAQMALDMMDSQPAPKSGASKV